MPIVNTKECIAAGLDPNEVARIARGIERYARQAHRLGIELFGGSGTCTMRFSDKKAQSKSGEYGNLILVHLYGFNCDGGDGGNQPYPADGLERGEY